MNNRWKRFVRYEPDTGLLYWLPRRPSDFDAARPIERCDVWNGRYAGKEAFFSVDKYGYKYGQIDRRKVFAHRIAWFISHGDLPPEIDHINGNRSDNRLINLRAATRHGNVRNTSRGIGEGSSKFRGVQKTKSGKFAARIKSDGKTICLGTFDTERGAASAYITAAKKYHGEFAPLTLLESLLEDLPELEDA